MMSVADVTGLWTLGCVAGCGVHYAILARDATVERGLSVCPRLPVVTLDGISRCSGVAAVCVQRYEAYVRKITEEGYST